jgi:hypothetical protein
MTFAKAGTLLGALIMAAALAYAFTVGDFWGDGRVLMAVPWGQVSLIDVYVGFALFCGWVAFRERRVSVSAAWIVLVLVLGNMLACLYAFLALVRSRGDWTSFWMGARGASRQEG